MELLVPVPFDALYPHYLCAKLDAALGETERYAGEQARYNSILAELSAWLAATGKAEARRSCGGGEKGGKSGCF